MAFTMMSPSDAKEEKVIGIKLDISPDIVPRDNSIGTKIFMLVPHDARNVREVKTYIAKFVLKTPAPFHLYMGEYRIREEEDVQIFSIINEPCRLVSVPIPRSALSSTPKPKMTDKRVTFFDGDLSTSPVHGLRINRSGEIDHSRAGGNVIHSPEELPSAAAIPAISANVTTDDQEMDLSDSSLERKKRRRRRHRSKKSKTSSDNSEENCASTNGSETVDQSLMNVPNCHPYSSGLDKNHLEVLNEETESEDETAGGSSIAKDFEFVTPITNNIISRKRTDGSKAQGGKKKKLSGSDSAFESSCSFTSPIASSSLMENSSSSGKRQDTPIVPRVVRNPKMFDTARKIIDVFATEPVTDQCNIKQEIDSDKEKNSVSSLKKDVNYYRNLPSISCTDEITVGDSIAFKVLELDERYNPTISPYKEGIVTEKMGTQLRITFTKNNAVVRTGRYDFRDDSKESNKEDEKQQETVDLHFSELLEPKSLPTPNRPHTGESQPTVQDEKLIEGNGHYSHPSPPNII